jgi:glycogen phosphorylase
MFIRSFVFLVWAFYILVSFINKHFLYMYMQQGETVLTEKQRKIVPDNISSIAYFSMEIGFLDEIPTYSGGLGILAGDTLKSFADSNINVIGITLLSQKGYFYQKFNEENYQQEEDYKWDPEIALTLTDKEIKVSIKNRDVFIRVWKYELKGFDGHILPIYFLDTNHPNNDDEAKTYTQHLYGGDLAYRLAQEMVLGIGGLRLLRSLDIYPKKYHLNEGHAAFLTCELDNELQELSQEIRDKCIQELCSFTTHTPVPAGHDMFSFNLINDYFPNCPSRIKDIAKQQRNNEDVFSMTKLAMYFSSYVNAVSHKHMLITKELFPQVKIDFITNGVHTVTWTNEHFANLYDMYISDWKRNSLELRKTLHIPVSEILQAHHKAKEELINFINSRYNAGFESDVFTMGFARRATAYKRALLLFKDKERLKKISLDVGKIQIIFAGKAHPNDHQGKKIIQKIKELIHLISPQIKMVFLDNYTMFTGKLLTSGVDLWLNTPKRGLEASGTSGMKAAHNGVPSLSILDGWWIEGCVEGQTGWSIGREEDFSQSPEETDNQDAQELYYKLESTIIPLYYNDKQGYGEVMRSTIAINATYFNTYRMVKQYLVRAYTQNLIEW